MDKFFEDQKFDFTTLKDISILKGSEFVECKFEGLDLTQACLNSSKIMECSFERCNLSSVTVLGSTFRDVNFKDSKISGVNFSSCNSLNALSFENCILDFSVF